MLLDRTRRGRLGGAAVFAAFALLEAFLARRAQLNHPVLNYKGSWFTPEVGYIIAFCFLIMAVIAAISAFRKSNDKKS